ncbi:MAG: hypothetical protein NC823_00125 [Candidatus Omnitrophica bacterium]|nr:hypothetical protein [Candidatus Omnitrophota bacterium]
MERTIKKVPVVSQQDFSGLDPGYPLLSFRQPMRLGVDRIELTAGQTGIDSLTSNHPDRLKANLFSQQKHQ